jgi:hypothetical protein
MRPTNFRPLIPLQYRQLLYNVYYNPSMYEDATVCRPLVIHYWRPDDALTLVYVCD